MSLGLLVGAFLLSCASYALVENPIRRGMRSRAATAVVAAFSVAAVLGTAAVSLAAIDREQRRFETPVAGAAPVASAGLLGSGRSAGGALPAVVAAVEAARRGAPIPTGLVPPITQVGDVPAPYALPDGCIGYDGNAKSTSKICRVGDRSSRKLIVLMGDSHANMWLPALLEMARRDHWAVVPLLRIGCTPGKWVHDRASAPCRRWHDWALRTIRQLHPRLTLLGGSVGERDTPFTRAGIAGVVETARSLQGLGRVVVIGDPEGLDENPIDCLLSRNASMAHCTTTWPAASLKAYDKVRLEARRLGVGFLRTRGFVCYRRECPAVVGHTIVWRDNSHLTATYSAELAHAFRAGFLRAVPTKRR